MEKQKQLAYDFDFVHDGQQVFRELLSAMSNPGSKRSIRKQSEKFTDTYAVLTAIGCTILDNEQKMYVEKNQELASRLHNFTLCRNGHLGEADYVFLSAEMNYGSMEEILKNVKKGSYADPQDSATLFVLCQELEGKTDMTISGPGVEGSLKVKVSRYIKTIVKLRQSMEMEYPLGVELVFVDPYGEIMCIPRLCEIKE